MSVRNINYTLGISMQYKLLKRYVYEKRQNPETKLYELVTHEKWGAKRKGRWFGFWDDVGEELCDSQGNTFITQDWFDSYEIAKSYLIAWHGEHYSNEPLIILNEINEVVDAL